MVEMLEGQTLEGGHIGEWVSDPDGQPVFRIFPGRLEGRSDLVLPRGGWRGMWHQVGNMRITATACAGGGIALYVADRGLVKIHSSGKDGLEMMGRKWRVVDARGEVVLDSMSATSLSHIDWGTSYAKWVYRGRNIGAVRKLSAPIEDFPAILLETCVLTDVEEDESSRSEATISSFRERRLFFQEEWTFRLYPFLPGMLMSGWASPPSSYKGKEKILWNLMFFVSSLTRVLTEGLRRFFGRIMLIGAVKGSFSGTAFLTPRIFSFGKKKHRNRKGLVPLLDGSLFMAFKDSCSSAIDVSMEVVRGKISVKVSSEMQGSLPYRLYAIAGKARRGDLSRFLEDIPNNVFQNKSKNEGSIEFHSPDSELPVREQIWHCAYLRGAFLFDRYLDTHFLPQGSAYGFVHGAQGAPRDYTFSAIPLTYLYPEGAKEIIKSIMRMMREDGAIYYSHVGRGICTSGGIHHFPSDLPLFFMWALTEYVWATRDFEFLGEEIAFHSYRREKEKFSSVLEKVLLAFHFLKEEVGTGEHGMLRLGGGDWMDPLPLMVEKPRRLKSRGESGFSSALAVYVLPRAAELIRDSYPQQAGEMVEFAGLLRRAIEDSWRGNWFLRGWDGSGNPIGLDRLFLDVQCWCLIAQIGSTLRRMTLVENIYKLCDKHSPAGATIIDSPVRTRYSVLPPGWDCNGGVWPIICALLTWGYALHSKELAWESLKKIFLSRHAREYPHVWFGIWSGPDSYNSRHGEREGETFVQPATPMMEFPVMNSNTHVAPLLGVLKICGIEATPHGIEIEPRIPDWVNEWRLDTALFSAEFMHDELKFRMKV